MRPMHTQVVGALRMLTWQYSLCCSRHALRHAHVRMAIGGCANIGLLSGMRGCLCPEEHREHHSGHDGEQGHAGGGGSVVTASGGGGGGSGPHVVVDEVRHVIETPEAAVASVRQTISLGLTVVQTLQAQ